MIDITMGRYSPGSSVAHRSDPRTKLIATAVFMTGVFFVESPPAFLALLLFALCAAHTAGKSLKQSLMGLRPILWLASFAVVLNLFIIEGTPVTDHGIFQNLSREGIGLSVRMVLRLILLASATSLLTFTTTPLSLMDGLEKLLKPLIRIGVPVHDVAMMMSLALRFVPMIVDEARNIMKAQSSRSAEFNSGSPLHRAKNLLPLLVPLFMGVFRRGDALATAMEARCYRGSGERTRMRELRFSAADLASAGAMLAFIPGLILVEQLPL